MSGSIQSEELRSRNGLQVGSAREFKPKWNIGDSTRLQCFCCGTRGGLFSQLSASVIDLQSGDNINSMFLSRGVVSELQSNGPTSYEIRIGACNFHRPNLVKLYEITSRVSWVTCILINQVRNAVTSQEFQRIVNCKAYDLWKEKEGMRRHRDWMDAIGILSDRLGHLPNTYGILCCAEDLWGNRKDKDALEDWLEAEKWARECHPILL